MKEIGGYFELGGFYSNEYHKNAISLNTATNSVIYIIKAKKINKIYLPYYLCNCLDKIKEYCEVEYYKINEDFTPNFNIKLKNDEYLYIVNYFGLFNNHKIKEWKRTYNNVIIDNVQAFFQMPVNGIDTIYSCRKFFGVPDGAYLYTDTKLKENILEDESKERFKHLLGRVEKDASSSFKEYKENEETLLNIDLAYMSKSTELILNALNYAEIKKKRTENFKYLNTLLKNSNKLKFKNIVGAYMYPYYTDNADAIRKKLIENKIYVPILWPNVLKQSKDKISYNYALNILLLPCDQRYGKKEIDKIFKILKEEKE